MGESNISVNPSEFQKAEGLGDWRVLGEGAVVFYPTDSFEASVELVRSITDDPSVMDHPPAVDIREGGVTFRLVTRSAEHYGMSQADVVSAKEISAKAQERGFTADPSRVQYLLVIPGASSTSEVMPFWQAALGYVPRPDSPEEDLVDPQDRGPAFWFEPMKQTRPDGGGAVHVAIWVPEEQAEGRVAAALAAGGRLVRDQFAPAWWTLADAAGNEADIATVADRD
jgi:4a-hydroxytetrahydrobiopterin dehydratase